MECPSIIPKKKFLCAQLCWCAFRNRAFLLILSYGAIASSIEFIFIAHRTTGENSKDLGEAIALTGCFAIAFP
jgi:hypothetical protein